jgi:cell division protein FtsL
MDIKERQRIIMEKGAANVTKWIGSSTSVFLHTILFIISFVIPYLGLVSFERMLLVLTTIVSLEAIYLSIFIQMSINMNNQNIEIIQEDISELGEDIEELGEDIEDIQKDVDEIQEDTKEEQDNEKKESEILLSIQDTLILLKKEIDQLKHSGK